MIEFADCTDFIKDFDLIHKKKIVRIPYTTKDGCRKTILMCRCLRRYISLPYMSVGVIEQKPTDKRKAPFMLFETEEGNIISTSKCKWEIRDMVAHSNYIYADKLFIWLDIERTSSIDDLFTSNVKRKIHKAIKDGISVQRGSGKKIINDFYKVYTLRMKEISVAPIGKDVIYRAVKQHRTDIFVAYKDNKPVGGATLNFTTSDIFANGLFATLSAYNKHYVSYLLHYSMINYAKSLGAIYYSFGRSTRNSSVHTYKKHYKGEEIPLFWSYSHKTKNIRNNKKLYSLWRKVPYFATKIIGPIISRYIY